MKYRIERNPYVDPNPLYLPVRDNARDKEEAYRQLALTIGATLPITKQKLVHCGVRRIFCGKKEISLETFESACAAFVPDNAQGKLLAIVEMWILSDRPEFRGFRCATCQRHLADGAWHHLLREGGYLTPVHFCEECQKGFEKLNIADRPRFYVNRRLFRPRFTKGVGVVLHRISRQWNRDVKPIRKEFSCDACSKELPIVEGCRQAVHAWQNKNGRLIEFHFDRSCAQKIGIVF